MTTVHAAAVLMVLGSLGVKSQQPAVQALVGARAYVSPNRPPIDDATVILANGKITAVGRRGEVPIPSEAVVVDCTGNTVLAAFWNSHVHFSEPKWSEPSAAGLQASLETMLLQYGFAYVFDTGSFPATTLALRGRIESGELRGPRIFTTGLPFVPPNGTPIYVEPLKLPELGSVDTARAGVATRVREGVEGIKLMTTSITQRQPFPTMTFDVVKAASDEAHKHHKMVFAHPTNVAGIDVAIRGGVDVLLHTTPDDGDWSSRVVDEMRRHSIALVPTLKLWDYVGRQQGASEASRKAFQAVAIRQLRAFARAGGRILFGTDVGFMTDYDPSAEYVAMSNAELTFTQILDSLTTAPARQFGVGEVTGTLDVGKRADVVVLASDPALNITALGRVRRLYRDGRLIYEQPGASDSQDVARLKQIQQELVNAWLAQDRATIERLLAPDWTVTGPTGTTSTRGQVLADAFERRVHRLLSGRVTDVTVRMLGRDAAVVQGRTQASGTYEGAAYTATIRFTDVFERHGQDWRAVRSHASTITP